MAGLKKLLRSGFVRPNESVVLILTGHVLKDPEYSLKFHSGELLPGSGDLNQWRRPPVVVEADVTSVMAAIQKAQGNA